MSKVKLTQAQLDAINEALSHCGDADSLIRAHRFMQRTKGKWSIWPALNDVSAQDLHDALKYDYEVIEQPSPAFPETTNYNMKAFYGMPIRILRGQFKGVVLPITFIRSDAKIFEIGNEYFFRTCDIGDWWQFADEKPKADRPPTRKELEAELDYQLVSLHDAIEKDDAKEIVRCKQRLSELHSELGLAGEKHAV